MERLFRFYNQNRFKVWVGIIAIAFVILIIHTLNGVLKKRNSVNEQISDLEQNQVKYSSQSQSMVDGTRIPDMYEQDFGSLIDNFLTYCKNHEPERAYGLLAQDCKDILYPTEEIFKEQYYVPKFSKEKTFTFQSWTSTNSYIYLVKIFDNMLSTGRGSNQNYIQDYISVVKENDTYKLNVNSLVGVLNRNAKTSVDGIKITILSSQIFMDYEIVDVLVENDCSYDILLDSNKKNGSTYLVDENGIKYDSMLFENLESDFVVESKHTKEIKIKFGRSYQSGNSVTKYVFSDVCTNVGELSYDGSYEIGSKSITVEVQ